MEKQYKYQDLTHDIIGVAMEVHRHLGNGFQDIGLLTNFGSPSLQFKRVMKPNQSLSNNPKNHSSRRL